MSYAVAEGEALRELMNAFYAADPRLYPHECRKLVKTAIRTLREGLATELANETQGPFHDALMG